MDGLTNLSLTVGAEPPPAASANGYIRIGKAVDMLDVDKLFDENEKEELKKVG